jgi:amidase
VAQPELFGNLRAHYALYRALLAAVTGARNPDDERQRLAALYATQDDEFSQAHRRGLLANLGDYFTWHAQREAYRAAYRAFFREWDILLAPITLGPAFPHLDIAWPRDAQSLGLTVEINGRPVPYDLQLFHPALATLSGQPATAFPLGLTRRGLPIGLQAIGPYLEDRTPIRFAALLGQAFGGFQKPPGYDGE